MQQATLCFLVRGNPPQEILLGYKRAGFGAGKYTGFGGKVEAGETAAMAAGRELEEEAAVRVSQRDLQQVARMSFLFPTRPDWSQEVHVFLATSWKGSPVASPEMAPAWFKTDEIPYERMWQDSPYWLPFVLAGERIQATFTFNKDNETVVGVEISSWGVESR